MSNIDVFYIHGYEGSAQGTKGTWLNQNFSFYGPEMPAARTTHPLGKAAPIGEVLQGIKDAIAPCATLIESHLQRFAPKVVVASSFGTAVWLKLVQEKGYRIPSVLLAPACILLDIGDQFPHNMKTIIIHGQRDTLIPMNHAELLHRNSGPASLLWPIDDEHSLPTLTTTRPELSMAVKRLILEQGTEEDQQQAQLIAPIPKNSSGESE